MKFGEKMKNRFNRKRISQFLDKQGFYIVLFICVGIIGATAFWSSRNNFKLQLPGLDKSGVEEKAPEEDSPSVEQDLQADNIDIKVQDKESSEAASKQNQESVSDKKTVTGSTAKAAPASSSVKSVPKVPNLIQPVDGETIMTFARDSLVYSRTLEQWTTHEGLDIAAKEGAEVKAALGGVIEEADKDVAMGNYIIIDHGNGLKTKYANLSTLDLVKPGQKVERGEVISAVGMTASFEVADEAHLHFEVILNGKSLDPKKYIID